MYKLCKTEQSAARQRQLELGLQKLMLSRRFEDISISELCETMKIPRKSFYRYFSSKDGALFALLDHTMLEFYEQGLRSPVRGTPLGDLDHFFLFWADRRALLDALARSNLSGLLVERAKNLAQKERLVPLLARNWSDDVQKIVLSFAVCGLLSMVIQWHQLGCQVSPEEMSRVAKTILTRPMIPI